MQAACSDERCRRPQVPAAVDKTTVNTLAPHHTRRRCLQVRAAADERGDQLLHRARGQEAGALPGVCCAVPRGAVRLRGRQRPGDESLQPCQNSPRLHICRWPGKQSYGQLVPTMQGAASGMHARFLDMDCQELEVLKTVPAGAGGCAGVRGAGDHLRAAGGARRQPQPPRRLLHPRGVVLAPRCAVPPRHPDTALAAALHPGPGRTSSLWSGSATRAQGGSCKGFGQGL